MTDLQVRLRTIYDVPHERQTVFSVPYGTDLEEVAQTFRAWGVSNEDGDNLTDLMGEFRIGGGGPSYFEFVAANE